MDVKRGPRGRSCLDFWPFKPQPSSALPALGSYGRDSTKIYKSLDTVRNEIRILKLAPGMADDPIAITLSTISLDDLAAESYEALSYVWGDASVKREIELCSIPFTVTLNLEAALIRMRLPDQTRRLWVDAICVNQEDICERENQVRIMGKVYSLCKQALVWLGPEETGDVSALRLIDTAVNGELATLRDCNLYDIAGSADFDGNYNAIKCNNYFQELGALLNRTWWSRSWTLQELALAPEATFHFGDLRLSWEQLSTAITRIQEGPSLQPCYKCAVAKLKTKSTIGYMSVIRRIAQSETPQNELLDMVIANRSRLATDPRDKVFAFLGLNIMDMKNYQPCYTASTGHVYSQFAWEDILQRRNLCVLNCAVDNDLTSLKLPSWVPDWSAPSRRPDSMEIPRVKVFYYQYNASGGQDFTGRLHQLNDRSILEMEGFRVDAISVVGDLKPDFTKSTTEETFAVLKQWLDLSGTESDPCQTYQKSKATLKEAFWRTLIGDIVNEDGKGDIRVTPSAYERSFWKAWEFHNPETSHQTAVDISENGKDHILNLTTRSIIRALYHAQERRFVVSEEGFLGNCCRNVRRRDEIWIVKGGRMPLILRKAEADAVDVDKNGTLSPLYTFVGDCYVHGIMDGERVHKGDENYERIFLA